jgi:hypothetical protein
MSVVPVSVDVSKETYELCLGLAKLIKAVKSPIADGVQPGDLPALIGAVATELLPALNGVDKIAAEYEENKSAFGQAVVLGLAAIAKAVES